MSVRTILCCMIAVLVTAVQALPPPPPPATTSKKPAPPPPVQKKSVKQPAAKKVVPKKTAPPSPAAQATKMYVNRAAIALEVIDHEPKDTASVFPPSVERLYCFTEIKKGAGEEIQHRWYWNDKLVNTVPLGISSDRYRTYSAKAIIPGMEGEWRVSIVRTTNEEVLETVHFQVK